MAIIGPLGTRASTATRAGEAWSDTGLVGTSTGLGGEGATGGDGNGVGCKKRNA